MLFHKPFPPLSLSHTHTYKRNRPILQSAKLGHPIMGNVVELKVGLHCEECIKKILKAIKKFEDIDTYDVDTQLNKVTVTGNVTSEQVIKALQKIGKQASHWEVEASC